MKLCNKQMLKIIGEQMARIIELNEYIEAADIAFGKISNGNDIKKTKR